MGCKKILLNRLITIELHNLKKICPFVYKIADNQICAPLGNIYVDRTNNIINNDDVGNPLSIHRIFFFDGFNEQNALLSHIDGKYNYTNTTNTTCNNVHTKCGDCANII